MLAIEYMYDELVRVHHIKNDGSWVVTDSQDKLLWQVPHGMTILPAWWGYHVV